MDRLKSYAKTMKPILARNRAKYKAQKEHDKTVSENTALKVLMRGGKTSIPQYKKGGKVKKTGLALVHKGEKVLTKKQANKFNKRKFEATRRSVFGLNKKGRSNA